jgi:hypothetical protein
MRRLAPLVLSLALVAGCGGSDGDDGAKDALEAAAKKTTGNQSAQVSIDGTIEGTGLPKAARIRGSGVFDTATTRARIELDFSSFAALAPTQGVDPQALRGEFIQDGKVMYMRLPVLQQQGLTKEWLKVDAEELAQAQGLSTSSFGQFTQFDPSQSLKYLLAVSGDVEELGEEDVRGVQTTRYRTKVDLEKVPDVLPEDQREQARKSIKQLVDQVGESEIPIEVWIDGEGLVRRQRIDYGVEQGGQEVSLRFDIELFDFGIDADIQPPPKKDTTDFSELLSAQTAPQN